MKKIFAKAGLTVAGMFSMALTTFASTQNVVDSAVNPVIDLINSLLTPLLAIVVAIGSLYCVILGVKYAKAEEPQDREKAKSHLKNAIIGFILIFVLMLALKIITPSMQTWVSNNAAAATTLKSTVTTTKA